MEARSNIMATPLNIVGQYSQDGFEQNYRNSASFFTLDDFIFQAAASVAAFYQQLYEKEYARMRWDGQKDEVVAFSNDFLSTQTLKVQNKYGETFAILKEQIFSFAFDASNVGLQNVFCSKPAPQYELERSDVDELWQLKYLAATNTIFYALDGERILLIKKGLCNVEEVKVLYVPAINSNNPTVLLPDAIVKPVIDATVQTMREQAQKIIKKTNDLNPNVVQATEINQDAAKP